jgi:hypothetical protein
MIRPIRSASLLALAFITMLLVFAAGCGSASQNSQSLSQTQAQAVSQQVETALQTALNGSFFPGLPAERHHSLAATLGELSPDQSSGCTSSPSGMTCNIPVSESTSCPGGGTMAVAGDFDFTLNSSGDGSDSSSLTITPTNCSVSNLTINGDPNITVTTQMNFTNNAPAYPITLTETGGISYGPNPSGSCSVNVTMSISHTLNPLTSCTITGTICGQSVNGSC